MLQHPIQNQPAAFHGLAALLVCSLAAIVAGHWHAPAEHAVDQLLAERNSLEQQKTTEGEHATAAASAQPQTREPWPLRGSVDTLVQQASLEALLRGLVVRSLSVSHQAATPTAWGKVNLEVSTTGTYAAFKVWQAGLMQAFPSLAVQK